MLLSSSITFLLKSSGAFFGFLLGILITRNLGINDSGLYFLALNIVTVLTTVCSLGLQTVILKNSAISDGLIANTNCFYAMKYVAIFSTVIIIVVIYFAGHISSLFNKNGFDETIIFFIVSLLWLSLNQVLASYFQGSKNIYVSILISSVALPLLLLSSLLVISTFIELSAKYVAIVYSIVSSAVFLFFYLKFFHKKIRGKSELVDFTGASNFWLINISNIVISNGVIIISSPLLESSEVALISTAMRISILISFVLTSINHVVAPKIASLYANGEIIKLKKYVKKSTSLMMIVSIPTLAVILIFPEFFMGMFGDEFKAGSNLLVILCVSQLINVFTGSVGVILSMTGFSKDLRRIDVGFALIAVLSSYFITKLFGIYGIVIFIALLGILKNLIAFGAVRYRLGFYTVPYLL
jgi:O-antigen/teichoic acid export membrane protein